MNELKTDDRIEIVLSQIREDGSISQTTNQLVEKSQIWLDFNYADWKIILKRIKNEPLKLYSYITFAYKVLGLELIHEFSRLPEIKKEVLEYVDDGKRFPIHSIDERDIKYFLKNKFVIDGVINLQSKYKDQGANVVEQYKVRSRRKVGDVIKRYVRIINRKELTSITSKDLVEEQYLVSERRIGS